MTGAPDIQPDLHLRPEPPRVTRLSRKVLIALGGVGAIAIMAAFFWALNVNRRGNPTPAELYSTENRTTADGLAGLPKDYTGIPKLGPPLPGDLGRPILSAQNGGQPIPAPGMTTPASPGPSPEEQRRAQELEAARTAWMRYLELDQTSEWAKTATRGIAFVDLNTRQTAS